MVSYQQYWQSADDLIFGGKKKKGLRELYHRANSYSEKSTWLTEFDGDRVANALG